MKKQNNIRTGPLSSRAGSTNKIKTAVLGATGLVGQQFVRLLADHPWFELECLCASDRSYQKEYGDSVFWMLYSEVPPVVSHKILEYASIETLKRHEIKVVFCALPAEAAGDIESELVREGIFVFSNTRSHRMDPEVPILIPEVNAGHLEAVRTQCPESGGFIVTNSNCSTTGLVMVLKPLMKFGIQSVRVSTYQAVSGAGLRGLASLRILNNVIPYISAEEEKMERESRKILGEWEQGFFDAGFDIEARCCRVPVRDGHLENVWIEFEHQVEEEEILSALRRFSGTPQALSLPTAPLSPLLVCREPDRPQPVLDALAGRPQRANGMAVSVGRIKAEERRLSLSLLVHNTIRGAAGTCVLNAELALARGFLPYLEHGIEEWMIG